MDASSAFPSTWQRLNGLKISWPAVLYFWIAGPLNVASISYSFYRQPERRAEDDYNLSTLIIIWFELLTAALAVLFFSLECSITRVYWVPSPRSGKRLSQTLVKLGSFSKTLASASALQLFPSQRLVLQLIRSQWEEIARFVPDIHSSATPILNSLATLGLNILGTSFHIVWTRAMWFWVAIELLALTCFVLGLGLVAIVLKLRSVSFLSTATANEWSPNEWLAIISFMIQLAGLADRAGNVNLYTIDVFYKIPVEEAPMLKREVSPDSEEEMVLQDVAKSEANLTASTPTATGHRTERDSATKTQLARQYAHVVDVLLAQRFDGSGSIIANLIKPLAAVYLYRTLKTDAVLLMPIAAAFNVDLAHMAKTAPTPPVNDEDLIKMIERTVASIVCGDAGHTTDGQVAVGSSTGGGASHSSLSTPGGAEAPTAASSKTSVETA